MHGRTRWLGTVAIIVMAVAFRPGAEEAQPFDGSIYHIAPTGDDANPGTAAAPFRTIQHCADLWNDQDRVSCRGTGVFHEEVVLRGGGPDPTRRNQLIAWDTDGDGDLRNETFVLDGDGTRNIGIWAAGSPKPSNIEIAHMTVRNYEPDGGCGDGGPMHLIGMPWGSGASDWWLHHNTFENMGMNCDWSTSGASYIAIRPSGAPNMIIEHNTFRQIGGFILRYIGGGHLKFRYNTVEIVSTGIKPWGNTNDNLEIVGNVFNCDGNGANPDSRGCLSQSAVAFAGDVQNSVIRDNVFNDCLSAISFATEPVYGARPNAHNIVENNVINRSPRVCNIYAAPVSINDCTPESKRKGAQLVVQDIVFRNNIINFTGGTERGAAIFLRSGHPFPFTNNIRFYNNTIHGYRYAIRVDSCSYEHRINGITFMNNIFSGIRDGYITLTWNGWNGPPPQNWVADYNTLSGTDRLGWPGGMSFTDWQALGNDTHSRQCSPAFRDLTDFHLQPSDTCAKDRGTALSGFAVDLDGQARPQGAAWDIGADEVAGGAGCR